MADNVNYKTEDTIKMVDNLIRQDFIIVYGAGKMAQIIYPCLKECNINIKNFVVSNGQNHKKQLYGIPVYDMSELNENSKNSLVLVVASIIFWDEIKKNLQEKGYNNYIILTPELRRELFVRFFKSYFNKNGIDYSEEIINFGKFSILNPMNEKNNTRELSPMFGEFGDLILPCVFDDSSLVLEGPYEYDNVMLEKRENGIAFDCGANMGLFSCYAAAKGYTSYAFEPTESLNELLKEHSKLNHDAIIPCNYAISDKSGKVSFGISNYSSGGNSFVMENGATDFVEVDTISIDEFVKINKLSRVDFIKADIEGAERQLIMGATETLKNYAPMLSICTYHLPDDPEVLESLILEANPKYRIIHKWMKLYAYVDN